LAHTTFQSYELGNISKYLSQLNIGDKVTIKGPKGQFKYAPGLADAIGMIAGGTGITPMLQIIRAVLKNPDDQTKLSLIYANVTFADILLKKELDELVNKHSNRFKVYYVLNNPPEDWTGGVGFVSQDHISTYLPASSDRIKILMCGPPPMLAAMKLVYSALLRNKNHLTFPFRKHLANLKYEPPRTISKLPDQVRYYFSTSC
jgi:cytochrome-b5 reductase